MPDKISSQLLTVRGQSGLKYVDLYLSLGSITLYMVRELKMKLKIHLSCGVGSVRILNYIGPYPQKDPQNVGAQGWVSSSVQHLGALRSQLLQFKLAKFLQDYFFCPELWWFSLLGWASCHPVSQSLHTLVSKAPDRIYVTQTT